VKINKKLDFLDKTYNAIKFKVENLFYMAPKDTRKEFALWAKENCPEEMSFLFQMLDEKPPTIKKYILKSNLYKGLFVANKVEEEIYE